ncbi:MAG TPA: transcriptional repressor LexA [Streptosporangiaceae bacterium]
MSSTGHGEQQRCRIIKFVTDFTRHHGYGTSVREIAKGVVLAPTTVHYHVEALVKAGKLRRVPGKPRTILPVHLELQQEPPEMAEVELLAHVAASFRHEAILLDDEDRKRLPIPRWLVGYGDLVMVRVFGASMIDAAIAPGDLAVIRKQQEAENGEIVAARLPGHAAMDATIKEFKRDETGRAWLIPRNPADQQPIPADDAQILGKVVTVMRMLR